MDPIEAYPPEHRREVMLRRALIGDRFDRYDEDPEFHRWVLTRTDEILAEADALDALPEPEGRRRRHGPAEPATPGPLVDTVAAASFWIGVMHRRSIADAEHIAELYNRAAWLALPWWRRAGRRPPWLRRPPKFTVGRHLRP